MFLMLVLLQVDFHLFYPPDFALAHAHLSSAPASSIRVILIRCAPCTRVWQVIHNYPPLRSAPPSQPSLLSWTPQHFPLPATLTHPPHSPWQRPRAMRLKLFPNSWPTPPPLINLFDRNQNLGWTQFFSTVPVVLQSIQHTIRVLFNHKSQIFHVRFHLLVNTRAKHHSGQYVADYPATSCRAINKPLCHPSVFTCVSHVTNHTWQKEHRLIINLANMSLHWQNSRLLRRKISSFKKCSEIDTIHWYFKANFPWIIYCSKKIVVLRWSILPYRCTFRFHLIFFIILIFLLFHHSPCH